MKPIDALEIQREYRHKCQDAQFSHLLNTMINSASGIKIHTEFKKDFPYGKDMFNIEQQKTIVSEYLKSAMRVGKSKTPCYFVKDEMTDLITFASNKLDDTDLFDETLVPTNTGFVYFEKPLEVQDVRGRKLLVNVMVWEKGTDKSGKPLLAITCYNDAKRTPDDVANIIIADAPEKAGYRNAKDLLGSFHWIHSATFTHGEIIGEALKNVDDEELLSLRNTTLDKDGNIVELNDEAWEQYKKEKLFPFTNVKRLIHTYFLIMSQTLTAKETERGDRAQRRRLERENLPSEVLVIQFRKTRYTSADKGEERAVNWSHRWLVGGHWRWQPYKDPASGGEIKKRIWISPYVKGPDDKPLKTKERVYVLAK